ncbi:MAG: PadR family transcriptional regulator [Gemmatimonadetes bacterium]|nr:PadR family transcriptional regulator [Gemmatimonadota bacterium]
MSAAPLGSFEEQVLLAVLRTRAESYGMAVRREIEGVTGREVAIGAVYATLDRLEAKGLVASSRGHGTGSRRLFEVTGAGAAALVETRGMRDRLWRGVELGELFGDGAL